MDRGAWWAVVHGVAQSRTRLKQLSCSKGLSGIFALSFKFQNPQEYLGMPSSLSAIISFCHISLTSNGKGVPLLETHVIRLNLLESRVISAS